MNGRGKLAVVVVSVVVAAVAGLLLAEWLLPPVAGTGMQGLPGIYLACAALLAGMVAWALRLARVNGRRALPAAEAARPGSI